MYGTYKDPHIHSVHSESIGSSCSSSSSIFRHNCDTLAILYREERTAVSTVSHTSKYTASIRYCTVV
jgi:hypothetical protein